MDPHEQKPGTSSGGSQDGNVNNNPSKMEQEVNLIDQQMREVRIDQELAGANMAGLSPLIPSSAERAGSIRTDGAGDPDILQLTFFQQPNSTSGSLTSDSENRNNAPHISGNETERFLGYCPPSESTEPREQTRRMVASEESPRPFSKSGPRAMTSRHCPKRKTITLPGYPYRNTTNDINAHNMPLTGPNIFKCHECDYCCDSGSMLASHQVFHQNLYPYRCGECQFASMVPFLLRRHYSEHRHKDCPDYTADGETEPYSAIAVHGARNKRKFRRRYLKRIGQSNPQAVTSNNEGRSSFSKIGNPFSNCRMEAQLRNNRSPSPDPNDSDLEQDAQNRLQPPQPQISSSSIMTRNNTVNIAQQGQAQLQSCLSMGWAALYHNFHLPAMLLMQSVQSLQHVLTRQFHPMNLEQRIDGRSNHDDSGMETDESNNEDMEDEVEL